MRTSLLRAVIGLACVVLAAATPAYGQGGTVDGTVTDSLTGEPVFGVRVVVESMEGMNVASGLTDREGRFAIAGVAAGQYTLALTRVGYRAMRVTGVTVGTGPTGLRILMAAAGFTLDAIVVSASRSEQAAIDAPAAVSVVDRRVIGESAALTPVDHIRDLPGVDFSTKGLIQHTFSARGDRGASSGSLLMLTDYRYAVVPSIGFNVPYLIPATNNDLERVEVMRGPGAALYGPSSHQGVLHLITRSPFESTGGALTLTGGPERSLFEASGRYAVRVSQQVAFKLSGKYFRGEDWEYRDPVEEAAKADAIAQGANPATLLIGKRDFTIENASGEARLDWRPDGRTELVMSAGASQAIRNIELAPAVGSAQGDNWRYSYGQVRFRRDRLFANVIYNRSDAGDTYLLRTGAPLVDDSRMFAAQLQHGGDVGPFDFLYGADIRTTDPRTDGTINGRNENDDLLTEIGGYIHATAEVSPQFDLIAAGRVDYHDRLADDLVFSPRVGFLFKPTREHALRATYNRAFNSPDPTDLFLDIVAGTLPGGLPYSIRALGSNRSALTYNRGESGIPGLPCGTICMRSPFFPSPTTYLPSDATLLWPAVVQILLAQGIDISGLPAPTAAQVGSVFAALDLNTQQYVPISAGSITDLAAGKRTITDAFEVGYKGVIEDKVLAAVDVYVHHVRDPVGELFAGTPNVFLNGADVAAYLGNFLPAPNAAALAAAIAQIPLGTVSPEQATDPTDILLFNRQGGSYTFWGADFSVDAEITPEWFVNASYSFVSKDSIGGIEVVGSEVLDVPRNKGSLGLQYRNDRVGVTAGAKFRAVQGFPVVSGVYRGRIDSYQVVDASFGYAFPWNTSVRLSLDAYNLLDDRHQEFIGAPRIGRLLVSRLQVEF